MPEEQQTQRPANKPELKIGPFAGGISVNVWRNTVESESGPRTIRSISISPRRYRDPQSREWKDSYSYRPVDLAAIILGLQKAQEFIYTTPVPGQEEKDADAPF